MVSMVLLLVMTLIGMAGIEVTGLEEKMVLNMRDRQAAFEAAEAALTQAEQYLENDAQVGIASFAHKSGTDGLYDFGGVDGCNKGEDADEDEEADDAEEEAEEVAPQVSKQVWEKDWDAGCRQDFSVDDDKSYKQLVQTPQYVIEEMTDDPVDDSQGVGSGDTKKRDVYYRITVMAKGLTDATEVRLQTVYKVQR